MKHGHIDERQLLEALRGLPRSRSTERDLWPGIADRIAADPTVQRRPLRRAWWGVAAALAVAFVVGLLAGRELGVEPQAPAMAGEPPPDPAMVAMIQGMEREYRAALQAFLPTGSSAHMVLQPPAVQDIQATWNELQQAETALMAALAEHPGNAFLGEKLLDLRARQLAFMRQIHMLDQNSRRET